MTRYQFNMPDLGEGTVEAEIVAHESGIAADVLLITDGEIWAIDALLESLANAQHRLFVIAVGASPAEELARQVAKVTRGACEFVTPGEDMRGAVARLLARMGSRRSSSAPGRSRTASCWARVSGANRPGPSP